MALREIRVSERMGNRNERERKKVSFKNWYMTSSGRSRCHVVIGEALVNFHFG